MSHVTIKCAQCAVRGEYSSLCTWCKARCAPVRADENTFQSSMLTVFFFFFAFFPLACFFFFAAAAGVPGAPPLVFA